MEQDSGMKDQQLDKVTKNDAKNAEEDQGYAQPTEQR
jgi:hypothetical protein